MTSPAKTLIITGASDGIGRELALTLARPDVTLVLGARNETALREVATSCERRGARALHCKTDVAKQNDCETLIRRAVDLTGRIDVLINNAGISMSAAFSTMKDLSIFERLMAVNYLGAVYCTHAAMPYLEESRGLIVAVSSGQGKSGFPRSTGYAASKFAMQGFFDSLRMELLGTGVDVLVVSPGPVDTKIHERRIDGSALSQSTAAAVSHRSMPLAVCVSKIVRSMERRDRELITHVRIKLLLWLRMVAPRFTDKLIVDGVQRFYAD